VFKDFGTFTGSYRQRSAALQYFREEQERFPNPIASPIQWFPRDDADAVAAVSWGKGEDWTLDRAKMLRWSWKEMVAQLDAESMRIVVQGVDGRSRGLLGCYFAPRDNSDDPKRYSKLRQEGQPLVEEYLPVWDFVFVREDGTAVRLHPHRITPMVETFEVEGTPDQVESAAECSGGSWCRGTYECYQTMTHLTFDPLRAVGWRLTKGNEAAPSAQVLDRSCGLI